MPQLQSSIAEPVLLLLLSPLSYPSRCYTVQVALCPLFCKEEPLASRSVSHLVGLRGLHFLFGPPPPPSYWNCNVIPTENNW